MLHLGIDDAPYHQWPSGADAIGHGIAEAPLFTKDIGGFNAITVSIPLTKPLNGDPATNAFACRAGILQNGKDVTKYDGMDVSSQQLVFLNNQGPIDLDPQLDLSKVLGSGGGGTAFAGTAGSPIAGGTVSVSGSSANAIPTNPIAGGTMTVTGSSSNAVATSPVAGGTITVSGSSSNAIATNPIAGGTITVTGTKH
ncbi:MAG: hypothetical protein JOZ24_00120 [Candidatus Eremiobacteraeota bacterium]|nr:hypothetical protein [Candidatus Eremiobacteraeota bacterium]